LIYIITVKILAIHRIEQGTYTYNQDLDKFDWKLQEEQKEILGYNKKGNNGVCR
jgi:GLPGLI family protein